MNGHSQQYIDWMARTDDDDRAYRDWQEMRYEMTRAEREEYEAWLDSLPNSSNGSPNTK